MTYTGPHRASPGSGAQRGPAPHAPRDPTPRGHGPQAGEGRWGRARSTAARPRAPGAAPARRRGPVSAPARGEARRGRSRQGAGGTAGRPRLANAALPGVGAGGETPLRYLLGGLVLLSPGDDHRPPSPAACAQPLSLSRPRSPPPPPPQRPGKGMFPAGGCRVPPPPLNGSPAPSLRTSASGPCHSRPKGCGGRRAGAARLPGGSCD